MKYVLLYYKTVDRRPFPIGKQTTKILDPKSVIHNIAPGTRGIQGVHHWWLLLKDCYILKPTFSNNS